MHVYRISVKLLIQYSQSTNSYQATRKQIKNGQGKLGAYSAPQTPSWVDIPPTRDSWIRHWTCLSLLLKLLTDNWKMCLSLLLKLLTDN